MKSMYGGAAVLATASGALAQSSPYYLSNGDGNKVCVVQNGVETNRWDTGIYCYPIAVSNGEVRVSDGNGGGQPGKAYDLAGNFQGALQSRGGGFTLDATSDGSFNYFSNGSALFRTNLDWSGATQLFNVAGGSFNITYDGKNKSIWTASGSTLNQYDLAGGGLMSSFNSGNGNNCGLAWELATDTLWMYAQSSNLLRQYDKGGTLLNSVPWNNPFGDNVIGGEFETVIPAPGAAALVGLGGLAACRRRR